MCCMEVVLRTDPRLSKSGRHARGRGRPGEASWMHHVTTRTRARVDRLRVEKLGHPVHAAPTRTFVQ